MSGTNGGNKLILSAQSLGPYEVTVRKFAQLKDDIFAHVYKALCPVHIEQIILTYLLKFTVHMK